MYIKYNISSLLRNFISNLFKCAVATCSNIHFNILISGLNLGTPKDHCLEVRAQGDASVTADECHSQSDEM